MASKYWIKLYHEMLYDRKIATLDDRLWRRFIECLLMAGEVNKKGLLPPLDDMAWILRADIEQLETELNELVKIRVLEIRNGFYFVSKFNERQAPMPKAEYMKRLRDERQKDEHYQSSYQPVTDGNAETDIDTDTESDKEGEGEPAASGHIFQLYESEIGLLTPMIAEQVGDWVDDYPELWIEDAIRISVSNGVRKANYVEAILKRWKTEGRVERQKNNTAPKGESTAERLKRLAKELEGES